MRFRAVLLACLLLSPSLAEAQDDPTWRSWNQPVEPFRIAGNLYYVGASDIAAYLVATPEGHIVIDGGFPETAPLIRDSIQKLGFKLEEVEILLNSHAHFDHAGGLAALQEWTGAQLWVSAPDAPVIEAGGAGDHFLSDEDNRFPAAKVDRRLQDGDTVALGGATLTARFTPGHTRGCTTWTLQVEEGGKKLDVVSVCSVTVLPGVELVGNPKYPNLADDFRRTFEVLESLPCDVFLAAHGGFFNLTEKRAQINEGGANPFVDPAGYRAYIERGKRQFLERLGAK